MVVQSKIPSLDGLRAASIVIVLIGHGQTLGDPWPGHVGVTVFFFLSGFLITTLLRREYEANQRISLGRFYLRRALRILPPAWIAITLCVIVGAAGILPSTMNIWGTLSEYLNYTNYYLVYADQVHGERTFGLPPESTQLWSLAVEEHFYLVFPLLLIVLTALRIRMRTIGWALLAAGGAVLVWRLVLSLEGAGFYRLYVSTDTKFDGLVIGAAMALLFNPALGDRPPFGIPEWIVNRVLAPVGVVVFVIAAISPEAPRLAVADSAICLALIPVFWFVITRPTSVAGRVLNHRWVAHLGVLSFSVYLLHRLVLGLVQLAGLEPWLSDLSAYLLVLIPAQLMFLLVERPLGRVRRDFEARLRPSGCVSPAGVRGEATVESMSATVRAHE
ncbi:acyltransferase [Herbiconiux sp. CPCC 203407]|uniref:Acyltransferase n=1 Tax=Herbiconiux oxytropis TaxID=2970915 RepID=A0AA41XD70_9MICO|nr:acyltransferase [Herbiconiux oxytropis]MCS5720454.1 acyltransferase [Herbiconiux oxytropis]MCS5726027.1 acyltransferase [Herbiconiux oxytropis]